MIFSLLVQESAVGRQSSHAAYRFACALIARGCTAAFSRFAKSTSASLRGERQADCRRCAAAGYRTVDLGRRVRASRHRRGARHALGAAACAWLRAFRTGQLRGQYRRSPDFGDGAAPAQRAQRAGGTCPVRPAGRARCLDADGLAAFDQPVTLLFLGDGLALPGNGRWRSRSPGKLLGTLADYGVRKSTPRRQRHRGWTRISCCRCTAAAEPNCSPRTSACSRCEPPMTLHILSTSPFAGSCLAECRRVIATGDALLLTGDGVYAALGDAAARCTLHAAGVAVFALAEGRAARGIDARLPACIATVDYGGFVDLAVAHPRTVSWF
jgi:tRNA 2-thiouridine synthesizing protein B